MSSYYRNIRLEPPQVKIIKRVVTEKGLGGKGFSAAIRLIITEWDQLQAEQLQLISRGREALQGGDDKNDIS